MSAPLQSHVSSKVTMGAASLRASSRARTIDATDDWDDLEARIAVVPADAKIRGMFLSEALRLAPRLVKSATQQTRYVPFSLYPVQDYMRLLLRIAAARSPSKSAGTALLELGFGVYSQFASSIAGTAIFAMAQLDFRRVCELSPKAYGVTLKPGGTEVVHAGPNDAVVRLVQVWAYPDIFHTGIWLGAMEACGASGTIEVKRRLPSGVELHMHWKQR